MTGELTITCEGIDMSVGDWGNGPLVCFHARGDDYTVACLYGTPAEVAVQVRRLADALDLL